MTKVTKKNINSWLIDHAISFGRVFVATFSVEAFISLQDLYNMNLSTDLLMALGTASLSSFIKTALQMSFPEIHFGKK